jgi:phage recombination protein Bet
LKLFLFDCHRQGVHPLDKLLHFTKRGGKYTPITSIDFMRTRAADTGEYAGSDDARFAPTSLPHPTEATVKVWRLVQGQRCPFEATARWDEYCPPSGQDHMWRKMPHTMLGKCAEALALRKGFPRQLAGLYATEEMDQADSQRPAVVDAPAASHSPAVRPRVDPSVGDSGVRPSGAEVSAGAARAPDSIVDEATGEELPPGFARIDAIEQSGAFTKVFWGRDAKGGWRFYSTKLPHIANAARAAFEDQVPVLLHSKDGKYLDKVERYVAPPEDDDVPPF